MIRDHLSHDVVVTVHSKPSKRSRYIALRNSDIGYFVSRSHRFIDLSPTSAHLCSISHTLHSIPAVASRQTELPALH